MNTIPTTITTTFGPVETTHTCGQCGTCIIVEMYPNTNYFGPAVKCGKCKAVLLQPAAQQINYQFIPGPAYYTTGTACIGAPSGAGVAPGSVPFYPNVTCGPSGPGAAMGPPCGFPKTGSGG